MIAKITRAYVRYYSDSGQSKIYVEWLDDRDKPGRTEGPLWQSGEHMGALLDRAIREGVKIQREYW